MSSRAWCHFGEGHTAPEVAVPSLILALPFRVWPWCQGQGPSTAPDKARGEPDPGSLQEPGQGWKETGSGRDGPGDKAIGGFKMQPGDEGTGRIWSPLWHTSALDAASTLPVGPRSSRETNLEANMPTEQLRKDWKPGIQWPDPRGKGVGTGPLRPISGRKSQHFREENPFTEDLCLAVENTQYTELKKLCNSVTQCVLVPGYLCLCRGKIIII